MQSKKSSGTYEQLERIVKIHEMLLEKKYPNTTTLSKIFERNVSTINRDIQFLRDSFLAPIEFDFSKNGYFYTDEKFTLQIESESKKKTFISNLELEKIAKLTNLPIQTIQNLEKYTILNLPGETEIGTNISCKYTGRFYFDGTVWLGLKAFDNFKQNGNDDYKLCISVFEYYGSKKTASIELQNRHLNYIAEDSPIENGYWLYVIFDMKLLEGDEEIAKCEFNNYLSFLRPEKFKES